MCVSLHLECAFDLTSLFLLFYLLFCVFLFLLLGCLFLAPFVSFAGSTTAGLAARPTPSRIHLRHLMMSLTRYAQRQTATSGLSWGGRMLYCSRLRTNRVSCHVGATERESSELDQTRPASCCLCCLYCTAASAFHCPLCSQPSVPCTSLIALAG